MKMCSTSRCAPGSLLVLAMAGVALGGERVPLDKVPAPAVKYIKDSFAKAEIRFVDKESKDRYEFAMKEGARQFDVEMTAEGKFVSMKEEITADKVPALVKEGLKKKFTDVEISEGEKITKGEGEAAKVTYLLSIKTKGSSKEVEVDAAGKVLDEK
jgi:hypothetical protein